MIPVLLKVPGIEPCHETHWKIYALAFRQEGQPLQSEVFLEIHRWSIAEASDYKRIINAMRRGGIRKRGQFPDDKYICKCDNSDCGDVYEFRANAGKARVMFFYYEPNIIVCTNTFWKTNARVNQNAAFLKCGKAREYFIHFHKNQPLKLYDEPSTYNGSILIRG